MWVIHEHYDWQVAYMLSILHCVQLTYQTHSTVSSLCHVTACMEAFSL